MGCIYQLTGGGRYHDGDGWHAMVKFDDGRFVRVDLSDLCVANVVDELAALTAAEDPARPTCDPQVLRALRAELHQHRGGHLSVAQHDVSKLSTVTAHTILHALQSQRTALNQARSQPWRKVQGELKPRWKHLGFASQQQFAAQVGANQRRIAVINHRLSELGWFDGAKTEEGVQLIAEKDRLVDQIAPLPPLPPLPEEL